MRFSLLTSQDCDTAFKNGATVAPGGLADCNMLCNGNSSEYCGAGNRLNVYKLGYGGSSSTVSSVPISTSATLSTTPSSSLSSTVLTTSSVIAATATPTLGVKPTVESYSALGCYTEATNGRALTGAAYYENNLMTLEYCANKCTGYTYWGVEYGQDCKTPVSD